jgi:hypothetical protein
MSRRTASPGSSPGLSTKAKTKLWNKLRKLDALCAAYKVAQSDHLASLFFKNRHMPYAKKFALFKKYDEQRKQIRWKLKGIIYSASLLTA